MIETSYIEYPIKILCSILIGFIVGFERQIHSHDAGIKTNILVAVGSCIFSIMSYSIGGVDVGRISAQIVTGISFLCAGTIVKEKTNIRGLTTAGVLWVTASLGMCIGFGKFGFAFIAAGLIQLTLFIIQRIEHLWRKKK